MSKHAWAGCRGPGLQGSARPRTAFTLIEVLVVVAIIALLVAILMPSLKAARDQAKITTCGTNLHQLGIALVNYVNDNKGDLPLQYRTASAFTTYYLRSGMVHGGAVNLGLLSNRRYASEPHVYYCPGQDSFKSASLTYDKRPENPWVSPSEWAGMTTSQRTQVKLRSSYVPRLIEVPIKVEQIGGGSVRYEPLPGGEWWTETPPINGGWRQDKYYHKVIVSDFTGVWDWTGGGVDGVGYISSPHSYKGFNRLFGDMSVRWIHRSIVEKTPLKSLPTSHANYNKPRPLRGDSPDYKPDPYEFVAYFKDVMDRVP